MSAPLCGGNKARSLEFLLGGVGAGDTVITIGGEGSSHVLATAVHARRLGARTIALRWRHDMNPVADEVSARIGREIEGARVSATPIVPMIRARLLGMRSRARFIPLGGSVPSGILGHVNAALELAAQIEHDDLPLPRRIVLPLGSGGTAAGLLLGFAVADLRIEVVCARVGPAPFVNRRRVLGLAQRTAHLIRRLSGERLPQIDPAMLRIVHHVYGGAYGRPLAGADKAANILHDAAGIRLDGTYSGKAWVAALGEARGSREIVLFWLTFDAKCLTN